MAKERRIILLARAFTDWNISKEEYPTHARRYSLTAIPHYLQAIEWWERNFKISYFDYRRELARITYQQWADLPVDIIIKNPKLLPDLFSSFCDDDLVLPCDDDDFISKDLIPVLHNSSEDILHWSINKIYVKPSNNLLTTDPLPFPTNGYAVSIRELKKHADYMKLLTWHLEASLRMEKISKFIPGTFNLTVKYPTSIQFIKGMASEIDFIDAIMKFNETIEKIPNDFEAEKLKLKGLQVELISSRASGAPDFGAFQ